MSDKLTTPPGGEIRGKASDAGFKDGQKIARLCSPDTQEWVLDIAHELFRWAIECDIQNQGAHGYYNGLKAGVQQGPSEGE